MAISIALKMTGCRNNRYELEQILSWAVKNGIAIVKEEEADFCIINTCTVTHVADKKSRQMVRKIKNNNPNLKTIVFGCAARMQKEDFEKIMEVDYLLPDMPAVIGFLEKNVEKNAKCQPDLPESVQAGNSVLAGKMKNESISRSRPLVQIQDGCDNYCSYCIIAAARGKSKNRPIKDIVDEIRKHQKNGYNEVVLTGINIGAYGASLTTRPEESRLAELLEIILEQTDIPRIRLSSMGPEFFNDHLFSVLKNPRLCRHIHLSIQSASDGVLERMKRRYKVTDIERVIQRLKNNIPGIAITTDFIVGFPGETDEEFAETMDFVQKNPFAKAHVFPYSVRKNTLAATMEQVPDKIKKERAGILRKSADRHRQDFIKSQMDKEATVIWETKASGLTDHYIRVKNINKKPLRSLTPETLQKKIILD